MATGGATLDAFSDLADVVDAIGNTDFFDCVAAFCEKASGCNSTVVGIFERGRRPRHVFNNLGTRDENRTIRPYFDGPYLLDPFTP